MFEAKALLVQFSGFLMGFMLLENHTISVKITKKTKLIVISDVILHFLSKSLLEFGVKQYDCRRSASITSNKAIIHYITGGSLLKAFCYIIPSQTLNHLLTHPPQDWYICLIATLSSIEVYCEFRLKV